MGKKHARASYYISSNIINNLEGETYDKKTVIWNAFHPFMRRIFSLSRSLRLKSVS